MHVVKIKTTELGWIYLNLESISHFYYDTRIGGTFIKSKTGETFKIDGDLSGKLAKLITTSTSGSTLTLE